MNELSLFTGAGGGILGSHLLGWRPIGYVEWDDYCQRVLAARIADGFIPEAPIFGDVREFVQSGAAEQYRGFVDVVSAGFPCQPFSTAGKQRGAADERNMWPATRDVIRLVRPRHVILENVPGLLTAGYASIVIGDLAVMGYVGFSGCISAADTGAQHRRLRWWVVATLAHASSERCERISDRQDIGSTQRNDARCSASGTSFTNDPNTNNAEAARQREHGREIHAGTAAIRLNSVCGFKRWPVEPDVGRVVNGVASELDVARAVEP